MSDKLPTSVAITIASPRDESADYLRGVALFEVEETAPGHFLYSLRVRTIADAVCEAILVDWLAKRLPNGRVMIGWRLAQQVVPGLIEASDAAEPRIAAAMIDTLAAAVTIDAVDLADEDGCAIPPPRGQIGLTRGAAEVPSNVMGQADDETPLAETLAADVIRIWRDWARRLRPGDQVLDDFTSYTLAMTKGADDEVRWWKAAAPSADKQKSGKRC